MKYDLLHHLLDQMQILTSYWKLLFFSLMFISTGKYASLSWVSRIEKLVHTIHSLFCCPYFDTCRDLKVLYLFYAYGPVPGK